MQERPWIKQERPSTDKTLIYLSTTHGAPTGDNAYAQVIHYFSGTVVEKKTCICHVSYCIQYVCIIYQTEYKMDRFYLHVECVKLQEMKIVPFG